MKKRQEPQFQPAIRSQIKEGIVALMEMRRIGSAWVLNSHLWGKHPGFQAAELLSIEPMD